MMNLEDGSMMLNTTGLYLYCRYWKPELDPGEQPRALVFISHGFAEYCSTYEHVAKGLVENNFFVFAHDHVGHGYSQGERTMISNFSDFVDDVLQHVDKVREALPGLQVFLLGHSMGGLISLLVSLARPGGFSGVVLIAPGLKVQISTYKRSLAKVMSYIYPSYEVFENDAEILTRDPEEIRKQADDPLLYQGAVKAGLFVKLLAAQEEIRERLADISVPLLIQQGTLDIPGMLEGSQELNERAASQDKTLSIYEDGKHQLHNEVADMRERVLSEIAVWLQERC